MAGRFRAPSCVDIFGTRLSSGYVRPLQAANQQAQAQLEGFAPAQLPLLLCALAALGQEPGAALVNAVGEALAHQELQVRALVLYYGLCSLLAIVAYCVQVVMCRASRAHVEMPGRSLHHLVYKCPCNKRTIW